MTLDPNVEDTPLEIGRPVGPGDRGLPGGEAVLSRNLAQTKAARRVLEQAQGGIKSGSRKQMRRGHTETRVPAFEVIAPSGEVLSAPLPAAKQPAWRVAREASPPDSPRFYRAAAVPRARPAVPATLVRVANQANLEPIAPIGLAFAKLSEHGEKSPKAGALAGATFEAVVLGSDPHEAGGQPTRSTRRTARATPGPRPPAPVLPVRHDLRAA